MSSSPKLRVGLLGATGTVGQRFILLLSGHPNFEISVLGASSSSAGKAYKDAVAGRWKQVKEIPREVKDVVVGDCSVDRFKQCDVIFSGLDSGPAAEYEHVFRAAELRVFSNAKNYRQDPLCPLIVPLVNPSHLEMVRTQQASLGLQKGFIVTNANCSTTGLVIPLAALEQKFGPLELVIASTMQAISGAGYPGVSAFDVHDNVVPFISGEEEKMEQEAAKIMGQLQAGRFVNAGIKMSAHCNRVPVIDGHTETVSVRFLNRPPPDAEQVKEALRQYTTEAQQLKCHSAPERAIIVHEEPDRPQPRLDRDAQNGAGVNVGRIRQCPVFDIKFVVLSNNVMIGAATSSVINAEIALAKGYLS
ncbi:aspartate-semialdehyde dehydrogenase [Ceraceosorus bombacis]|uniref:Aspartate-semialdehyde dehydrogenase n=1 Tax=Ceraceosorus bombacis TaxID=401625 RepID=A0A0P1BSG8_9BASI|nr:aspartate-semialdehyde dehydrogenase [Ceraceosorus bombacis]